MSEIAIYLICIVTSVTLHYYTTPKHNTSYIKVHSQKERKKEKSCPASSPYPQKCAPRSTYDECFPPSGSRVQLRPTRPPLQNATSTSPFPSTFAAKQSTTNFPPSPINSTPSTYSTLSQAPMAMGPLTNPRPSPFPNPSYPTTRRLSGSKNLPSLHNVNDWFITSAGQFQLACSEWSDRE